MGLNAAETDEFDDFYSSGALPSQQSALDRVESRLRFSKGQSMQRSSGADEEMITTTRRTVRRGGSMAPAALDSYGEDYEYDNSGLQRARRALSEARDILKETHEMSVARESAAEESSSRFKSKRSQLDAVREMEESTGGGGVYYKMTITPQEETWSNIEIPKRIWTTKSSEITDALLAAYSPKQFPDFEFGVYDPDNKKYVAVNSWKKYAGTQPGYYDILRSGATAGDLNDTSYSSSSAYNASASSSAAKKSYSMEESSSALGGSSGGSRLDKFASKYGRNRGAGNYLNEDDTFGSAGFSPRGNKASDDYFNTYYPGSGGPSENASFIGKKARASPKFAHYWIPKHVERTPMLGGMLLPEDSPYIWKY